MGWVEVTDAYGLRRMVQVADSPVVSPPAGADPPTPYGTSGIPSQYALGEQVVLPYGFYGSQDGNWDDAAAINTALATGAPVRLIPGHVYNIMSTVILPAGGVLTGVSAAPDKNPGAMPVVLRLASGVNTHMIQLSGRHCRVSDLELDGNKAGQTSGFGNGILALAGTDWSVIERVYIHDQRWRGINIVGGGTNLQAIKALDCSVQSCGDAGIFLDASTSDTHIRGCLVGSCTSHNIVVSGYVTHIDCCDTFSSGAAGILYQAAGYGTQITNCGIDRNSHEGILIIGSGVSVGDCSLHSNSQGGGGTYGSITIDNTVNATTEVSVHGCNFWLDGGITNKPAYHIWYKNTASAKTHGNGFAASSYVTGTISAASLAKDTNETG